jgi:hypothetical protein
MTEGGDLVLAPKTNEHQRPRLVLVSQALEKSDLPGHTAAHLHLRIRKWEARRAWAGRALIAVSFPLAYLLTMFASGQHAPSTAARVVIWFWVAALTAAIACGEAIWRNRLRLERMLQEPPADSRS